MNAERALELVTAHGVFEPTELERAQRVLRDHVRTGASAREALDQLAPLCPCTAGNPADWDGPQQDCPIHGDGATFVALVRWLNAVAGTAMEYRATGQVGEHGATVWRQLCVFLDAGPEAFR